MVSYPQKERLKIYADEWTVQPKDDKKISEMLDLGSYKYHPERMMIFDIKAYDWNCPQHITPRYTVEEIETAFTPQLTLAGMETLSGLSL